MAEKIHCVEFDSDDDRYVAYGCIRDHMPVCQRSANDKWHRVTSMHWLSCTKFMPITRLKLRGRVTRAEIEKRYGVRLGLREPPPIK